MQLSGLSGEFNEEDHPGEVLRKSLEESPISGNHAIIAKRGTSLEIKDESLRHDADRKLERAATR